MKYWQILLGFCLALVSVSAQVSIQQILSEEVMVYYNEFVTINYGFTNHKELDIVNIRLIDKYPKDKFKSFEKCYNCELIEIKDQGNYKTLFIQVEDIKPNRNVEISYSVDLKGGEYDIILGEKYYDYMNRTQHRLGKAKAVELEKEAGFGIFAVFLIILVLIIIILVVFKKKRWI